MNSICNQKQQNSPTKNKIKAAALKYDKYCQKNSAENTSKFAESASRCIKKSNQILKKMWNSIVPTFVRGPASPYETFIKSLPAHLKNQLQNLPLSKLNLSEAISQSRFSIIITYKIQTIGNTLQLLNNSQQINSLIHKKGQIIPIKISNPPTNQVAFKIKQLMDSLGGCIPDQDQVYVIWKGLYEEILIIARFELSDPDLCIKVIRAVQERQDYEDLIKKMAKQTEMAHEQSSLNQLSQQSTGISKGQVD